MTTTLSKKVKPFSLHHLVEQIKHSSIIHVIIGSLLLSLLAQIAIPLPFTPIPLTLQSLTIFLFSSVFGSKKSCAIVITYLLEATIGCPVLAGGISNPLWIIGPKAGYLIGFLCIAYFGQQSVKSQKSLKFTAISFSYLKFEFVVLTLGTLWLSTFFGLETAILTGFVPFLSAALFKSLVAASLVKIQGKMRG